MNPNDIVPTGNEPSPNPDAELVQALMRQNASDRIAHRVPKLRLSSYALIGLAGFSLLQTLAMNMVFISVLSEAGLGGFSRLTAVTSSIFAIIVSVTLLITRSTRLARICLGILAVIFAYSAISNLLRIDITGTAIDGFITWWIYDLYQSVEALDIQVR